jgi:hypothetical protein
VFERLCCKRDLHTPRRQPPWEHRDPFLEESEFPFWDSVEVRTASAVGSCAVLQYLQLTVPLVDSSALSTSAAGRFEPSDIQAGETLLHKMP